MKTLLVTGASGFLGWHVCQIAQQQGWRVVGTYWRHAIAHPHLSLYPVDLSNFQAMRELMQQIQPDAVIHTAAESKANICQQQPETTYPINVIATWNLAELCADAEIPYLFTSTDLVFDGQQAPYRETDAVCPVNHYGEQKVEAEAGLLERYPQATVCRLPLMFGTATPTATCFLQSFLQTLSDGQPLKLFTDEFRTPVGVRTAAQGLLWVLDQQFSGIIHLGGRERVSRYELGELLVEVLQIPNAELQPCCQQDVPMAAPRPADVSLDSSLAFSLGFDPRSLREELAALATDK